VKRDGKLKSSSYKHEDVLPIYVKDTLKKREKMELKNWERMKPDETTNNNKIKN
jgi:hypothetical protein